MKPDCNILNPLQRDGLSQDKRLIRALHPSYVAIDEKDISDLLLYAKEYAQLIQYYSLENNPSGDWKKFIESDITTLVATIEKFDAKIYKQDFEDAIENDDYQAQFEKIFEVIQLSYDWYKSAIPELKLHTALERVINSILNNALVTSIAYAKRIEAIDNTALTIANLELDFSSVDIGTILEDTSIFPNNDLTHSDDKLIAQRKTKKIFDQAYETVLSIVFQAPDFLEETLEEYHQHNPHMALFLAFLKLFKTAQNHLNTITKQHLDFYYQEVLQLNLKPEQPDEVHLVFKLAKNFQAELVQKDTLLKAGKDDAPSNIFFGLDNDIVINKTQLYEDGLKTIFINKEYQPEGIATNLLDHETPYTIQNLHAATKANTLDGIEEELEENDKWSTLGHETMPKGKIGFAIGSPIFLLNEGTRIIEVNYVFSDQNISQIGNDMVSFVAHELKHNINVFYSGEKEWIEASIQSVEISNVASNLNIKFSIELSSDDPAFIPFQEDVLLPKFSTNHPVLQFVFNNDGLSKEDIDNFTNPDLTISEVKESATPYDDSQSYGPESVVTYNGDWYISTSPGNVESVTPNPESTIWHKFAYSFPYKYFQSLNLLRTELAIRVTGMQNLILENDVGVINPAKPFQPFGPLPKVGSRFYIGSHEIFQKALVEKDGINGLDINIDWGDLPEMGFRDYYLNYQPAAPSDDDVFKVGFQYLQDRNWMPQTPSEESFFIQNVDSLNNSPSPISPLVQPIVFDEREVGLANFENYSNDLKRGFVRLELKNHFLHKNYSGSTTTYVVNTPAGTNAPKVPYTPIFNSVTLDYRSEEIIDFSETTFKDSVEHFFHITPFGWQKFYPNAESLPKKEAIFSEKLIPEFQVTEVLEDDKITQTDAEGTLFIGLEHLDPEQNVSILFQMAEGSADPDLPKQEVVWSYLSQNHWIDFDRTQILSDTTNGLLTSGIVTLTMPKKMSKDNTILANGVYWIKVSVARLTKAISQAIAVMPQAVKASFRKTDLNDLSRLSKPLPAETISKLKERKAFVKSVAQPYSSFNGKLIEQNVTPEGVEGEDVFNKDYNEFYIRISERLRHKNRAITIDDYERIVLQQFPDVYKVKCINHTRILSVENGVETPSSEHAPGFVKLIVVPSLRNRNAVNPLQPRVSSNRLDEIKSHLLPLKSDFVTLEVQNPLFEEVAVDFKVRFLPGFDKGFYEKKLKEDIVRFLSPWLYDEGGDLALGGKIHRSVILNFVEETEYVDYVTNFKLNHFIPGQNDRMDVEEAVTATSSSVIVSVPAIEHLIDPNTLEAC